MVGAPYDKYIAWWLHHMVGAPFGSFATTWWLPEVGNVSTPSTHWDWDEISVGVPKVPAGVKEGTRKLS